MLNFGFVKFPFINFKIKIYKMKNKWTKNAEFWLCQISFYKF